MIWIFAFIIFVLLLVGAFLCGVLWGRNNPKTIKKGEDLIDQSKEYAGQVKDTIKK